MLQLLSLTLGRQWVSLETEGFNIKEKNLTDKTYKRLLLTEIQRCPNQAEEFGCVTEQGVCSVKLLQTRTCGGDAGLIFLPVKSNISVSHPR